MRLFLFIAAIIVVVTTIYYNATKQDQKIPLIAIANYGPHKTLTDTIDGIKEGMEKLGYVKGKTVRYKVADVNFEASAAPQVITHLTSFQPQVMVAISTPVSIIATNHVTDIPLICVNITDPSIITAAPTSDNIYIVSDKPNLEAMLEAIKKSMPDQNRFGVIFSTGEANDVSSLLEFEKAALKLGFEVIAVPLENSRDAKTRVALLKDKVDFIYLGSSGAVQSALPAITEFAKAENIHVISFDSNENVDNKLIKDFPETSYINIGIDTAKIIDQLLKHETDIKKITYTNESMPDNK